MGPPIFLTVYYNIVIFKDIFYFPILYDLYLEEMEEEGKVCKLPSLAKEKGVVSNCFYLLIVPSSWYFKIALCPTTIPPKTTIKMTTQTLTSYEIAELTDYFLCTKY